MLNWIKTVSLFVRESDIEEFKSSLTIKQEVTGDDI